MTDARPLIPSAHEIAQGLAPHVRPETSFTPAECLKLVRSYLNGYEPKCSLVEEVYLELTLGGYRDDPYFEKAKQAYYDEDAKARSLDEDTIVWYIDGRTASQATSAVGRDVMRRALWELDAVRTLACNMDVEWITYPHPRWLEDTAADALLTTAFRSPALATRELFEAWCESRRM